MKVFSIGAVMSNAECLRAVFLFNEEYNNYQVYVLLFNTRYDTDGSISVCAQYSSVDIKCIQCTTARVCVHRRLFSVSLFLFFSLYFVFSSLFVYAVCLFDKRAIAAAIWRRLSCVCFF